MYTEDIAEAIAAFSLNHHIYADDTQFQKNLRIVDIKTTLVNLELCVGAIKDWCSSRLLQLNADKTELIRFGSRSNLKKLTQAGTSLQLGSTTIEPVAVVRNLGVYMASELNMRVHIGKVAAICFFHLRRHRQLRFVLTSSSMQRFASALIISRILYCNSVLYGLPAITLSPLQRDLHAAMRLVANLGYHDQVTPAMKELHWLPIAYRIKYKLCLMMYAAVNNRSSAYITDTFVPISSLLYNERLRSHESGGFEVSVCAPSLEEERFLSPALRFGMSFHTIYKGLTMSQHLNEY